MSKIVMSAHQVKMATDVCTDYSIGQLVFNYLEKTMTDDDEIAGFVNHAGDCSFCMQTIIKWHYDCVVSEMNEKAAEMNAVNVVSAAFNSKQNRDWPTGLNTIEDEISLPDDTNQIGH